MCDLLEMKTWSYHSSTDNPLTASLCSSSPNSFSRASKVPGYLSDYPSSHLSILIFLSTHWTFLISSTVLSPLDSLCLECSPSTPLHAHTNLANSYSSFSSLLKCHFLPEAHFPCPDQSGSSCEPLLFAVILLPLCSMSARVSPILNTQDTCSPPNEAI